MDGLLFNYAIESTGQDQVAHGFYFSNFIIAKKVGGWRPFINLKILNEYMSYQIFKMESL